MAVVPAHWRWRVVGLGLGVVWATVSVGADARLTAFQAAQAGDITVRGCVERDAASRVPLYKLAEDPPGTRIFRLAFGKDVDVPSQVGHTVDATGSVVEPGAGGQAREPGLTVKKLAVVRDTCTSPTSR